MKNAEGFKFMKSGGKKHKNNTYQHEGNNHKG